jgi:rubrerythrin
MDDMTLKMLQMLDGCEDVENSVAEIYHFFADHFRDNAEISLFWRRTALEEENHARQVKLAKKTKDSIVWVSIEVWRQVFVVRKQLRDTLERIRQSPPSLEEALIFSIASEEQIDHLHMTNAILMKEKSGNELFVAMMNEDREHALWFKDALRQLQAAKRKSITPSAAAKITTVAGESTSNFDPRSAYTFDLI